MNTNKLARNVAESALKPTTGNLARNVAEYALFENTPSRAHSSTLPTTAINPYVPMGSAPLNVVATAPAPLNRVQWNPDAKTFVPGLARKNSRSRKSSHSRKNSRKSSHSRKNSRKSSHSRKNSRSRSRSRR
jgi:hypothetical protein